MHLFRWNFTLYLSFDSIYISEINCLYAIGTHLRVISISCVLMTQIS
jgi:hypothetical protein